MGQQASEAGLASVAFVHKENQPFLTLSMFLSEMVKVYVATRLDRPDFERIKRLSEMSRLSKAEIVRRLILIGLRNIKQVEDLLKL